MTVFVTLLAMLKRYAAGKVGEDGAVTLAGGATVQQLLDFLAVSVSSRTVVLVNGTRRENKDRLEEGDDIKILSMAGGG